MLDIPAVFRKEMGVRERSAGSHVSLVIHLMARTSLERALFQNRQESVDRFGSLLRDYQISKKGLQRGKPDTILHNLRFLRYLFIYLRLFFCDYLKPFNLLLSISAERCAIVPYEGLNRSLVTLPLCPLATSYFCSMLCANSSYFFRTAASTLVTNLAPENLGWLARYFLAQLVGWGLAPPEETDSDLMALVAPAGEKGRANLQKLHRRISMPTCAEVSSM